MRMMKSLVLGAVMATTAATAQATAKPGLPAEKEINDGLLVVAVADKIRRECDAISARLFTARAYLTDLKDRAAEQGYSEAEIDSYINNDEEKAKMRMKRNAYFKARGASNLDPASLCSLGREEIRKQSQIGLLLKAK